MSQSISRRVPLVTGAARGPGRAHAIRLSAEGADGRKVITAAVAQLGHLDITVANARYAVHRRGIRSRRRRPAVPHLRQ